MSTTDEAAVERERHSPFRPILGSRAHEEVVDQITFAIRAGIYRPGDRLPRIEDLAKSMKVSKPTISEALRVLSGGGVVDVQRGATGGVVVASDNVPITMIRLAAGGRAAALSDLVEARRPIEIELAILASQRATAEDLDTLREAVKGLEEATDDPSASGSRLLQWDSLFHYGMGRAARSELLFYHQHQIFEQLAIWRLDFYQHPDSHTDIVEHARLHRETLEAIASADPDRIREVMHRHLSGLERVARDLYSNGTDEQRDGSHPT